MDFANYTSKSVQETLKEFETSQNHGLTFTQVKQRLQKYGFNQVVSEAKHFWWQVLARQFKSSFIYLLVAAALISFILGEAIDAAMIILFVVINCGLGFYQEYHSEKTIQLLKKYVQPYTKVVRDGRQQQIGSASLVPGDIVYLFAGDDVPADLRLILANNLEIDESTLSGESVQIAKTADSIKQTTQTHKAYNIAFAGTTVVLGYAVAVVVATSKNTVFGKVAKLTAETAKKGSFEKGISRFSRLILRLIFVTLVIIFAANWIIKGNETNFIELIIFSLALTVSVIPEALPVVTTFSLSRGAVKLAKNHVIVKRLSAVEDLGSIEVLCSDKTGTLTENKLKVKDFFGNDNGQLFYYAALAASSHDNVRESNNAFDLAIFKKLSSSDKKLILKHKLIFQIPFDPKRRRNSVLVKNSENLLIVRGASESILGYCENLSQIDRNKIANWEKNEGKNGCRVIAVATKEIDKSNYQVADEEKNLQFVGAISFIDPVKKSAVLAIEKARNLGVAIKILTGDSMEVAGAVGVKVGLIDNPDQVILGEQLEKLSQKEKFEACEKFAVFARVTPEQKFEIIKILQKKYEVGFLGEGINDAPALKIANVALVVKQGADIAKEAADIILLQSSLEVIVDGIKLGREVFANTVKYIKATLSSNFGNFYAIAIASLLIKFLPMLPLQILLVNLLSDFPMIAIATDNVDSQELARPRSYNVSEIAVLATILGIVSGVFDFIFFGLFYKLGEGVLQTNWFIASILTELLFLFSIRTKLIFFKAKGPSIVLIFLSTMAVILTVFLPFSKIGQELFKFKLPEIGHLILIAIIVLAYFVISEMIKLFYYQKFQTKLAAKISSLAG